MKLILVEWVDSAFAQGWMSKDSVSGHGVSRVVSVGLLLNETDTFITIMQDVSSSGYVGDGITIPKCSIKRIRYLKVK